MTLETKTSLTSETVETLQELMQREEDGYIRDRSQRALQTMNASVETF